MKWLEMDWYSGEVLGFLESNSRILIFGFQSTSPDWRSAARIFLTPNEEGPSCETA